MINLTTRLASKKLTFEKAARKAGMAVERLRQVASGGDASLGEMRAIAKVLQIPVSAMMGRDREAAEPIAMTFRRTLGQHESTSVNSRIDLLSSQVRDVLTIAQGQPSDLSWLDIFKEMKPIQSEAVAFASLFRTKFGGEIGDLEPFPHLGQVLSKLGVLLLFSRDPTIEGLSAIVDSRAIVIVGPRTFRPRMLFTLAHELGHLVARHDDRSFGYAHMDKEVDWSRNPRRAEEKFSDTFASALLLPEHGVLKALKAVRTHLGIYQRPLTAVEIAWVSHFFYVSFEVAARRFEALGLLPPNGARAFYQRLQDDFGTPERFAESIGVPARQDEIVIETAPALVALAAEKVRAGELSLGRAAEQLNVPVSVILTANSDANA